MELYVHKNQKSLRCGITTGTCAAIAVKAALGRLLLQEKCQEITVMTPKGIAVSIPFFLVKEEENDCEYRVQKDSGDDPDVTDKIMIAAKVSLLGERNIRKEKNAPVFVSEERFFLEGGEGIGTVTKVGLEQEIGYPAINKVPREMIFGVAKEVCEKAGYSGKIGITISAPQGGIIAGKTFNERLGIEGGISILGTSGIVEPMSEKALLDTIEAELKMKKAEGMQHLVMTPGNYGQKYAKTYLQIQRETEVKCSNYIGESLDLCVSLGFKSVLLIGNIGKLIKIAAGIMNTHSKVADGRMEILALYAGLEGAGKDTMKKIMAGRTTEEAIGILKKEKLFACTMKAIFSKIEEVVSRRAGESLEVGVILFSEKDGYLGETKRTKKILEYHKANEIL